VPITVESYGFLQIWLCGARLGEGLAGFLMAGSKGTNRRTHVFAHPRSTRFARILPYFRRSGSCGTRNGQTGHLPGFAAFDLSKTQLND